MMGEEQNCKQSPATPPGELMSSQEDRHGGNGVVRCEHRALEVAVGNWAVP